MISWVDKSLSESVTFYQKRLEDCERTIVMTRQRHHLINFPKCTDARGNLTFIESGRQVPFEIKRVYYLYDVPGGATRAGHALKNTEQVLIGVSGSFDIHVDYGDGNVTTVSLNRSYYGLYLPKMVWRLIDNFSSGAVCLCLVSTLYSADDYYRDYDEYLAALAAQS